MNWQPQEDFFIRISDETGEPRSEQQFTDMVNEIRQIANKYGFDLYQYGGWDSFYQYIKGTIRD